MSLLETKDTILTFRDSAERAPPLADSASSLGGIKRRAFIRATLALTDIAVATGSSGIAQVIYKTALSNEPIAPIPAFSVIAFYAILGLYVDWGLSPVERLRIRVLGTIAYLAVNTILIFLTGFPLETAAYVVCSALLLIIMGHYAEWLIRKSLVQWNFWGAPTILLG
jgi:hypothetical protein